MRILSAIAIFYVLNAHALLLSSGSGLGEQPIENIDIISRGFGSLHGKAICALDIMFEDKISGQSGVYIGALDWGKEGKIGVILTAAHSFLGSSKKIGAIGISFSENGGRDSNRLPAIAYVIHPDFVLSNHAGPDVAIVYFKQPQSFDVQHMAVGISSENDGNVGYYIVGGYGKYAVSGKDENWNLSRRNRRMRRIGFTPAKFSPKEVSLRDSFMFEIPLDDVQCKKDAADLPYSFATPTNSALWAMLGGGDSGGPLFLFDQNLKKFRVIGISGFSGHNILPSNSATGSPEQCFAESNWTAMTADVLNWIRSPAATKNTRINRLSAEDAKWISAIDRAYGGFGPAVDG